MQLWPRSGLFLIFTINFWRTACIQHYQLLFKQICAHFGNHRFSNLLYSHENQKVNSFCMLFFFIPSFLYSDNAFHCMNYKWSKLRMMWLTSELWMSIVQVRIQVLIKMLVNGKGRPLSNFLFFFVLNHCRDSFIFANLFMYFA